jgi:hypothetical protein
MKFKQIIYGSLIVLNCLQFSLDFVFCAEELAAETVVLFADDQPTEPSHEALYDKLKTWALDPVVGPEQQDAEQIFAVDIVEAFPSLASYAQNLEGFFLELMVGFGSECLKNAEDEYGYQVDLRWRQLPDLPFRWCLCHPVGLRIFTMLYQLSEIVTKFPLESVPTIVHTEFAESGALQLYIFVRLLIACGYGVEINLIGLGLLQGHGNQHWCFGLNEEAAARKFIEFLEPEDQAHVNVRVYNDNGFGYVAEVASGKSKKSHSFSMFDVNGEPLGQPISAVSADQKANFSLIIVDRGFCCGDATQWSTGGECERLIQVYVQPDGQCTVLASKSAVSFTCRHREKLGVFSLFDKFKTDFLNQSFGSRADVIAYFESGTASLKAFVDAERKAHRAVFGKGPVDGSVLINLACSAPVDFAGLVQEAAVEEVQPVVFTTENCRIVKHNGGQIICDINTIQQYAHNTLTVPL